MSEGEARYDAHPDTSGDMSSRVAGVRAYLGVPAGSARLDARVSPRRRLGDQDALRHAAAARSSRHIRTTWAFSPRRTGRWLPSRRALVAVGAVMVGVAVGVGRQMLLSEHRLSTRLTGPPAKGTT